MWQSRNLLPNFVRIVCDCRKWSILLSKWAYGSHLINYKGIRIHLFSSNLRSDPMTPNKIIVIFDLVFDGNLWLHNKNDCSLAKVRILKINNRICSLKIWNECLMAIQIAKINCENSTAHFSDTKWTCYVWFSHLFVLNSQIIWLSHCGNNALTK